MYPCSSQINSTLSVWLHHISDITFHKIYKYNWSHKICIENGGEGDKLQMCLTNQQLGQKRCHYLHLHLAGDVYYWR